jgi:hypothetical protein
LLRFDIEENTIIEAFVRFRFASFTITLLYYRRVVNIGLYLGDFGQTNEQQRHFDK